MLSAGMDPADLPGFSGTQNPLPCLCQFEAGRDYGIGPRDDTEASLVPPYCQLESHNFPCATKEIKSVYRH